MPFETFLLKKWGKTKLILQRLRNYVSNLSFVVFLWFSNSRFYLWPSGLLPWVSYQISKIAGCACAGDAGNVSPASDPNVHPAILRIWYEAHMGPSTTWTPFITTMVISNGEGISEIRLCQDDIVHASAESDWYKYVACDEKWIGVSNMPNIEYTKSYWFYWPILWKHICSQPHLFVIKIQNLLSIKWIVI